LLPNAEEKWYFLLVGIGKIDKEIEQEEKGYLGE